MILRVELVGSHGSVETPSPSNHPCCDQLMSRQTAVLKPVWPQWPPAGTARIGPAARAGPVQPIRVGVAPAVPRLRRRAVPRPSAGGQVRDGGESSQRVGHLPVAQRVHWRALPAPGGGGGARGAQGRRQGEQVSCGAVSSRPPHAPHMHSKGRELATCPGGAERGSSATTRASPVTGRVKPDRS
jgi:hypothetical protein